MRLKILKENNINDFLIWNLLPTISIGPIKFGMNRIDVRDLLKKISFR